MHGKCATRSRASRMNIYIQMVYINSTQRKNGLDRGIHPRRRYPPEAVTNSPSLARHTTALRITLSLTLSASRTSWILTLSLSFSLPSHPRSFIPQLYSELYFSLWNEALPKLKVDDAPRTLNFYPSRRCAFEPSNAPKIHAGFLISESDDGFN